MLDLINRDSKVALSVQVSENLIEDIRRGNLKPGKRLPGERVLAQRFGVSRGTVIEALDLLEKQNYIEQIAAKGTFIADDIRHELSAKRIIFPFPEAAMGPDLLGALENWGIVSGFYRGMLAEASNQNTEIIFQHFEEPKNDIQLSRQLRRLQNFDGGIFIGLQLQKLQASMVKQDKPCVALMSSVSEFPADEIATVSGKLLESIEQIIGHLSQRGYKQLRILDLTSHVGDYFKNDKINAIIKSSRKHGMSIDDSITVTLNGETESDANEAFAKIIPELTGRRTAFFCLYTDIVPIIYRYAMQNGLKIGEDFGVVGFASGVTFNNLMPELTYSKIDHFEMGRAACRLVINGIRGEKWKGLHMQIPNILITKQST